ncbi:MAG: hypothetical protein PHU07_02200 [Acidocella sp.]|nr:hypothetical protein [Acidocella sp.]
MNRAVLRQSIQRLDRTLTEQRLDNAEACASALLSAYRHAQDLLTHDETVQITGLYARAQHHVRMLRHELSLPAEAAARIDHLEKLLADRIAQE